MQKTFSLPAVVLAAGGSTRCPEGKLFKHLDGKPLITWGIETLIDSPHISEVLVVLGHRAEELEKLLRDYPVQFVTNPNWSEGLSSSIKVAISSVPAECPGTLISLADTPFFSAETLAKISPNSDELDEIRYPVWDGSPGHPKYFPRWLFPELLKLEGDTGAKSLLRKHAKRRRPIPVSDLGVLKDYDLPEDFRAL